MYRKFLLLGMDKLLVLNYNPLWIINILFTHSSSHIPCNLCYEAQSSITAQHSPCFVSKYMHGHTQPHLYSYTAIEEIVVLLYLLHIGLKKIS